MEQNKYVTAMKSLSLQALRHSKSGHPGMAMSASNITYTLYTHFLNISKQHPKWINRDRFVLSGGHGCLSIYSIFHFARLVPEQEILKFRNGSKWYPGHPEFEKFNYVDASTGPLGQGVANGVGMAIAQKYLEQRWSPISELIDHYTYVVCGDGDLQEGVSYEAMSIAGNLKLNKLIMLYDSNNYQLDAKVSLVNNENIRQRVESQNWNYIQCDNDVDAIKKAIEQAKISIDKPTFIEVKTIIGEGITCANSNKAHGASINDDEISFFNKYYGVNYDNFIFPNEIYEHFETSVVERGKNAYDIWEKKLNEFLKSEPELTQEFLDNFNGKFHHIDQYLDLSNITKNNDATKTYLKTYFNELSDVLDIVTLSADLASTTNCKNNSVSFNEDVNSGYIMMGVREFGMSVIQNGILYHGGLISFAGTFLSFSDYQKPSIRVGAMSHLPSNYIFTHDSYLVGPDGPTHQPYDQIPMLRAIENVYILRPCDEVELLGAMNLCLTNTNKTYCLILTRQATTSGYHTSANNIAKGAYIIYDNEDPDITIVANGSEVSLAMNAINDLVEAYNLRVKVVSCPSLKLFLNQNPQYIKDTLKSRNGVLTIENSNDYMWYSLTKYCKKLKSIRASTFGTSDNGQKVYEAKGFNIQNIVKMCQELINERN